MRSSQLNSLVSVLCLTAGLSVLSRVPSAQAHGAVVDVNPASVEVIATFDNGEAMSDAQVLVYSPADPENPWAKGQTDSEGRFVFSPDPSLTGASSTGNGSAENSSAGSDRWEVTVRKAGHGQTTSFDMGDGVLQSTVSGTGAATQSRFALQHLISVAAIIWGFVGTALYFKAKTKPASRYSKASSTVAADAPTDFSSGITRSDR